MVLKRSANAGESTVPDDAFSPSRIGTLEIGRIAEVTSALTVT